jgi:hypothetical protein
MANKNKNMPYKCNPVTYKLCIQSATYVTVMWSFALRVKNKIQPMKIVFRKTWRKIRNEKTKVKASIIEYEIGNN